MYVRKNVKVSVVEDEDDKNRKHFAYHVQVCDREDCDKPIVQRRYTDFVALYDLLMKYYYFRMVPALPAKPPLLGFVIENLRRDLQTWISTVAMHPVLRWSDILALFLSDETEEFMLVINRKSKFELDNFDAIELPIPNEEKFFGHRQQLQDAFHSLDSLRKIFDEQVCRYKQQARDMAEAHAILKGLKITDSDGREIDFDEISEKPLEAVQHSKRYAYRHRKVANEKINALTTLLAAYNDLCNRVNEGITSELQGALSGSPSDSPEKRIKIATTQDQDANQGPSTSKSQQSAEDPNDQVTRKYAFAMRLFLQETAILEQFLKNLPSILVDYAERATRYHRKMSNSWNPVVGMASGVSDLSDSFGEEE